jgi:hypothetical protein
MPYEQDESGRRRKLDIEREHDGESESLMVGKGAFHWLESES